MQFSYETKKMEQEKTRTSTVEVPSTNYGRTPIRQAGQRRFPLTETCGEKERERDLDAHLGLEQHVRVREESFLETDDDELGSLEAITEEGTDVLGVRQVEGGVDLIEDVHRSGLELEEGHDEGEGDERSERSTRCG
jgi:hypothetical protein